MRWLIAASWPYFHAAGNQSIPAVCAAINNGRADYLADRFYLPETPRDLRMLERAGIPVFGIESGHPLRDFDVAGTSISYAVLWMNFCKLLSMSGVPLRWREREQRGLENYPMIVAGGQAYCAPGFMEPVADCVFLGEVEDEPGNGGISQVNARIAGFKAAGLWQGDRLECYRQLAREFSYLYFPRFVEITYRYADRGLEHPSKQVAGYRSLLPGMRLPLRARKVKNLDAVAPLTEAPLIYSDPSMGAGDLEVGRGCPAWCSFCRLSWVTKPYRQRSVGLTVAHAAQWQRNMGSAELSPFAPDFPMHTQKKRLLAALLENVGDEIDTTAMRVDDFISDGDYVLLQAFGGADAVTLGLEGNSQRMRDLVGKGTSDRDVEEAVIRGIRAGFRKFKLFMITSMPGETREDVLRIVQLGQRLAEIRDELGQPNVRIQFSWTPLLIEAQTPFQWFAPTPPDHTLIDVANQFRDLRIDFKIGVKAEPNKIAFFQLCQRASREVGEAITDVIEALGTACWGGVPRDMRDQLEAALLARGFRNGFGDCFDERYHDDLFGWEFIDTGVSQALLWDTYREMVEFLEGTDAATYDQEQDSSLYLGNEWVARCDQRCQGRACGACDGEDLRLRTGYIRAAQGERDIDLACVHPVDQTSVAFRIRLRFERPESLRYVSTRHWRFAVRRAAYRAAFELRGQLPDGCGIAKRSITFASEALQHKDYTCGADYAEFGMTRRMTAAQVAAFTAAMARELAPWLAVGEHAAYPAQASLRADTGAALWSLEVSDTREQLEARLAAWDSAEQVTMVLKSDTSYFSIGQEEVNAKDYADDLWAVRDGHRVVLRMLLRGRAGPYNIYAALMGRASWIEASAVAARRADVFGAAEAVQGDLLRPSCAGCGVVIPCGLLGDPYSLDYCPRCADENTGAVIAGLRREALA